jgi:hypothetical protein
MNHRQFAARGTGPTKPYYRTLQVRKQKLNLPGFGPTAPDAASFRAARLFAKLIH